MVNICHMPYMYVPYSILNGIQLRGSVFDLQDLIAVKLHEKPLFSFLNSNEKSVRQPHHPSSASLSASAQIEFVFEKQFN